MEKRELKVPLKSVVLSVLEKEKYKTICSLHNHAITSSVCFYIDFNCGKILIFF